MCALISHLPHVVANVFAFQVYREDQNFSRFAGSSFRDFTRIAGSSPIIWLDIFLTNRDQIVAAIEDLEEGLRYMKDLVKRQDEAGLMTYLDQVKKLKEQVDRYDPL